MGNIKKHYRDGKQAQPEFNEIDSIKKENLIISDQVIIANKFNKYFSSYGQSKAEAIHKVDKDFSEFLPPSSIHSFACFPTDPVEIMEELERLETKPLRI